MLFSLASTVLGLVVLTQAVDHAVIVGGPGGVVAYNPPSVVSLADLYCSTIAVLRGLEVCGSRRHRDIHVSAKEPYRHPV